MTQVLIAHTYRGALIQASIDAGIPIIASCETEKFGAFTKISQKIQQHNWPQISVLAEEKLWPSKLDNPENTFIIAHPPCAAASCVTPNSHRGGLENPKSAFKFTADFLQWGLKLEPAILVTESVPGIIHLFDDLKSVRDSVTDKYGLFQILDNSSHYGAASTRKRCWTFFYRKDLFPNGLDIIRPTESKKVTVWEAIHNAPTDIGVIPTHQKTYNRFHDMFDVLPQGMYANKFLREGHWDLIPTNEQHLIKTKTNGEQYLFYESVAAMKLNPNGSCPSITGSTLLIHPFELRPLTYREMLRINGVPDTFTLPSSITINQATPFIGKAVCEKIAQWIIIECDRNIKERV